MLFLFHPREKTKKLKVEEGNLYMFHVHRRKGKSSFYLLQALSFLLSLKKFSLPFFASSLSSLPFYGRRKPRRGSQGEGKMVKITFDLFAINIASQ